MSSTDLVFKISNTPSKETGTLKVVGDIYRPTFNKT